MTQCMFISSDVQ